MLQRFLDPATLASISSLDLVAKTVVDGFVAGLHRSPDFGFSQEFAEYRAYSEGDDLRHVDWNVFARTDRCFLKRYKGETNSQLLILLDTSASMGFGSTGVTKLDYARFVAASLCYMANTQRDAAGLIVFDEDVKNYVAPSTRQGQLFRLLHAIEKAEPGTHTDFAKPFFHFQTFLHRRGIVVVMSDFYEDPDVIVKTVEPLRRKSNPSSAIPCSSTISKRPPNRSKYRRNMRAMSTGAKWILISKRSRRKSAVRAWTTF
jgi:uncharacterized protein (DUF58 family)